MCSVKMYIDLSNKVRILLAKNGYAVALDELDYGKSLLDFVYCRVTKCEVSEIVIISHAILSSTVFKNSGIAYSVLLDGTPMYALVNIIDIDKIYDLAKAAGVGKVRFVDSLGLCCLLGDSDVCYVEQNSGLYSLIHVSNGTLLDYRICSKASLHDTVHTFCTKNNLNKFENVEDLCSYDLLLAFYNVMSMNTTAKSLMIFAYAETEFSANYSFTRESMAELFVKLSQSDLVNEGQIQLDVENSSDNLLLEEDVPVSPDEKKVCLRRVKRDQQHEPKSKLGSLVFAIMFILVLTVNGVNFLFSSNISDAQEKLDSAKQNVTALQNQSNLYQAYLSAEANGSLFGVLDDLGFYSGQITLGDGSLYPVNGHFSVVSLKGDKVNLLMSFNTSADASAFVKNVESGFNVVKQSISTETVSTGETSYSLNLIFSLH